MKNVFKKYLWLWEFIGAALIIGAGIVAVFVESIVLMVVGCAFIIMGIFRVVPLFKTTFDKILKWIYVFEIVLNIGIGGLLIYLAIQEGDADLQALFGYLIGSVLYLRGALFFFATTVRKEDSDKPKFIAHLIFITIGAVVIGRGGFTPRELGWVILGIAILAAVFIAFSGFSNYRNYRGEIASKEVTKKVQQDKGLEAPTSDEITPETDKPLDDPKPKDVPQPEEEKQPDQLNA